MSIKSDLIRFGIFGLALILLFGACPNPNSSGSNPSPDGKTYVVFTNPAKYDVNVYAGAPPTEESVPFARVPALSTNSQWEIQPSQNDNGDAFYFEYIIPFDLDSSINLPFYHQDNVKIKKIEAKQINTITIDPLPFVSTGNIFLVVENNHPSDDIWLIKGGAPQYPAGLNHDESSRWIKSGDLAVYRFTSLTNLNTLSIRHNTAIIPLPDGICLGNRVYTIRYDGNGPALVSEKSFNLNIDYTNYSQYTIRVSNNTSENLVAFFGAGLSLGSLIGGISAGEAEHGFKIDPELFASDNGLAIITFITEKQYYDNIDNLYPLYSAPWTRIYVYYSANGTNENVYDKNVYEISGKLGGASSLVIRNQTSWNVELRLDGPHGTPLGYVPAFSNPTLKIEQGQYSIYPILVWYNVAGNYIVTVYPRDATGEPLFYQFTVDAGTPEYELNIPYQVGEVSTGSAYIRIQNNSGWAVRLWRGGTVQNTLTGISTIADQHNGLFQVYMPVSSDGDVADTVDVSQYSIETPWSDVSLGTLQTHILDVDYLYTITVTTDSITGNFVLSEPVKSAKKVLWSDLPGF